MEAHNFNILETKIRQAIDEIKTLKTDNAELRNKLDEIGNVNTEKETGTSSGKDKEVLQKINEMLESLDQL